VAEALEAGANDYLVKPFDSEELKARIGVSMRILQLEDDLIQAREAMRQKATHDALIPFSAAALSSICQNANWPGSADRMAANTSLHSDRNGSWSFPVAWSP
jgi:DNA-binding response OmpR family regulator